MLELKRICWRREASMNYWVNSASTVDTAVSVLMVESHSCSMYLVRANSSTAMYIFLKLREAKKKHLGSDWESHSGGLSPGKPDSPQSLIAPQQVLVSYSTLPFYMYFFCRILRLREPGRSHSSVCNSGSPGCWLGGKKICLKSHVVFYCSLPFLLLQRQSSRLAKSTANKTTGTEEICFHLSISPL